MDTIVWEKPDRSIAVTVLMPNTDIDAEIQKIQSFHPEWEFKMKGLQGELNVKFDFFFAAYEITEQLELVHNMDKAREIWREKISIDVIPHIRRLNDQRALAQASNDSVRVQEIQTAIDGLSQAHLNPNIDQATSVQQLMETYPSLNDV
jgi:hypothetical protein